MDYLNDTMHGISLDDESNENREHSFMAIS